MPKGTVRGARRVIAGLLVLAALLLGAAQVSMAMLANAHDDCATAASQPLAVTDHGAAAPAHDEDCDHGLPCCFGAQCAAHAYWIPVKAVDLPSLPKRGVVALPAGAALLSGIAMQPSSPPPRATV
jgi:hypothetical protein